MGERKSSNTSGNGQGNKPNNSGEKRGFSLPPTSSKPPMPPVKLPKKN